MATIRFGSNMFTAGNDFTIVGVDDSGNLIIGGFGPPPKTPLVWVEFKQGGAFLNANIGDASGEMVLQIKDNVITYNKNNIYKIEQFPVNQIPPDRVVVVNQYGETALDLRREGNICDFPDCDFQGNCEGHSPLLTLFHCVLDIQFDGAAAEFATRIFDLVSCAAVPARPALRVIGAVDNGFSAFNTVGSKIVQTLEITALALPVPDGILHELQRGGASEVIDGKHRVENGLQSHVLAF